MGMAVQELLANDLEIMQLIEQHKKSQDPSKSDNP